MWKQKEARACYFGKNPAAYKYTIYIILQLSSNSKTRSRQAAASKVVEVVVGDGGREEVQQTVDSHGPNDMNLQEVELDSNFISTIIIASTTVT